jgi:Dolichyl-phosphate-mannose-protein mannosyltransferase
MLYVSILVELLRTRPVTTVWLAALLQAAIWTLVPAVFYAGPPGNLPYVLAVGHEFHFSTYFGPPLAFWLAEIVFRLSGGNLLAIYALAQVCVVVTYWAVFRLGRAIVGAPQAAIAVLLMFGVSSFTVATPEFAPVVLAMPLWALTLLHYWGTITEGKRKNTLALAIDVALLLMTTYAAGLLIALLALFTCANARTRPLIRTTAFWPAAIAAVLLLPLHLYFAVATNEDFSLIFDRLRAASSVAGNLTAWLRQLIVLLGVQAGLLVLVAIVARFPWSRPQPAPVIKRAPVDRFARQFIFFFATMPAVAATSAAVIAGEPVPVGGIAPLIVLSGIAVVIFAGDAIALAHQRSAIATWLGLLLVPPTLAALAVVVLPWFGIDLAINQPVAAIAPFFADSFQRRIGKELPIITGDARAAALVSLAPSRPSLFLESAPLRSPWVSMRDIAAKGAIVIWPTNDTAGLPPAAIKQDFPDIVPEVPRTFERIVQGNLPPLRYGWAVIRPQPPDSPAPAAAPTPP